MPLTLTACMGEHVTVDGDGPGERWRQSRGRLADQKVMSGSITFSIRPDQLWAIWVGRYGTIASAG